jgi:hypothetical protein
VDNAPIDLQLELIDLQSEAVIGELFKQCHWQGFMHILLNKTFQRLGVTFRRCLYCLGQPMYVNRHFQWRNITRQVTDHLLLTRASKQSCRSWSQKLYLTSLL